MGRIKQNHRKVNIVEQKKHEKVCLLLQTLPKRFGLVHF